MKVAGDSKHLLQVHRLRTRVQSHHMRELTRGKFLVKSKDITLLECIGEGLSIHMIGNL